MQFTNDLLDSLNLDTVTKRRSFLKTGAIVATAAQLWMPTAADARSFVKSGRTLEITNAHTGEKFNDVFWENGKYNTDAFHEIKKIFRDHRANETFPIDRHWVSSIPLHRSPNPRPSSEHYLQELAPPGLHQ